MKALSIRAPWSEMIASGKKTVECRTWHTHYRGPLLIVSSASWEPDHVRHCSDWNVRPEDCPRGVAVCVVDLVDIDGERGEYEWHLRKPRRVRPVPIKGRLNIYEVADGLVTFVQRGKLR